MSESIHPTQALLAQASWLRALALELVRDGGEAEDVAQEALLRALEHPPREPGALRGFLRSVLRNVSLQRARGESRRREREQRVAREESLPATDEIAERLALHRRVVDVVQRLEEPYRSTILLRFFDGLAPREIAARRGEPVKTVHTRIQRALEKLRVDFDREHGEVRRRWAQAFLALLGPPRGSAMVLAAGASSPRLLRVLAIPSVVLVALVGFVLWSAFAAREGGGADLRVSGPTRADEDGGAPDAAALDRDGSTVGREPITSDRPLRVGGSVRTSDEKPVAGARIEVLSRPAASFEVDRGDFAEAASSVGIVHSDAAGLFALDVRDDQPWRLVVSAPGLGTEVRDFVWAGDDVDVTLEPAARFEYTIVAGEQEVPCGRTRLVLLREGVRGAIFDGATDVLGRAAIEDLAPGVYTIQATPIEAGRVFAIDLVLRAGESARHVLRAEIGSVRAGRVRSVQDGAAIPGARLTVGAGRDVMADELGRFELAGIDLDAGEMALVVQARGFARRATRIDRLALSLAEIEIELGPEGRARGVLMDADGARIGGAWIIIDGCEALSEADGSFVVHGLTPGSRPLFFARAEGHAPMAALFPGDVVEVELELGEIRLARPASLAGRVRTRADEGLAAAWVTLEALGPLEHLGGGESPTRPTANQESTTIIVTAPGVGPAHDGEPTQRTPPSPNARPFRDRGTRADAEGRFRLVDLAAGRYRVSARKNGRDPAPAVEIELGAGEVRGDLEILFEDGLAIEGRVRGADGIAIAGAWIVPSTNGDRKSGLMHLSGLDGRFTLAGLADAVYDLELSFHGSVGGGESARSYARTFLRGLRAPLSDLEVILPLELFVEGVLVDEVGAPIADVYIQSLDPEGRRDSAGTDARGRFRVRAAEGMTVILTVCGPVLRNAADAERAKGLPRWTGELADVAAGSRDVVLRAVPAR